MKRTDALRRTLKRLTGMYNDGTPTDVVFDDPPRIDESGTIYVSPNVRETFGRNMSTVNELRVLVNVLSHEVEHLRESELDMKARFAAEHQDTGLSQLAGTIINIVEDAYIDRTRTDRFRGLRAAQAFTIDMVMGNHHRRPRIDKLDRQEALYEGFVQVAYTGGAKGVSDAEPEVREYLARARILMQRARYAPTPQDRWDIADELFTEMVRLFPPRPDIDALEEWIESVPVDDFEGSAKPGDVDADAAEAFIEELGEAEADELCEADSGNESGDGDGDGDGEDEADGDGEDEADGEAGDTNSGKDRGDGIGGGMTDEIDDALDALDRYDEERRSGDWYELSDDTDYHEPDEAFVDEAEELQREIAEARTGVGARKKKRDERDETDEFWSKKREAGEAIEQTMRDSGLTRRIHDAFAAFRTADRDIAAVEGHDVNIDNVIDLYIGDYGREDLYWRTLQADTGDRIIGVLLDASGSMSSDMHNAKAAVAAVAHAAEALNDVFCASAFRGVRGESTPLITAPDEPFDFAHFDTVAADGGTPLKLGLYDMRELLDEEPLRQKVMIVITDGRTSGADSCARLIRGYREEGVIVIGLGLGGVGKQYMERVFGADGYALCEIDTLTQTLVRIYQSQLNVDDETRQYM